MNDFDKLTEELKKIQEENTALKRQNAHQEFVDPPDNTINEKKESIRAVGDLSRILAFFIDEKLTDDVSFKCFMEANNLDKKKADALYRKFAQRRFSMKVNR